MSEVPFTPAEHKAIDATLADRKPNNAGWAAGLADAFHVLPLERARKRPVNRGWPAAPALTEAALAWHLGQGGNVGALLGASGQHGLIAWDADNAAGAEAIEAAGYTPFAIPANALNPNHSKGRYGGRHFLWSVPAEWGVPGMELTSPRATVTLAGGGTVDVLAGPKFLVLPPSILCEEGHLNHYNPAEGWTPSPPPLPREFWPDWVRPEGTPDPPAELAALRVQIRRRTAFEQAEERMLSAGSRELTELIDSVPMATWLTMDDQRYIEVLDTVGSCGCPKGRFSLQSSATGMELHDGCAYGRGVHVYSGTLAAHLAGNGENRDHMSWPDFVAGLYGRSFRDVVRDAGIELAGGREDRELDGITAEQFEADAAEQEAKGNHSVAEGLRRAAMRQREAVMEWARRNGAVFVEGPVVGAMPSQPIVAPSAAVPALSVIQGGLATAPAIGTLGAPVEGSLALKPVPEPVETVAVEASAAPTAAVESDAAPAVEAPAADDPAGRTQAVKDRARAALHHSVEPELLERLFCTPQLKRVRTRAEEGLAPPVLALTADLAGVLSLVPPTTRIPPIVMNRQSGFNAIYSSVAESGGGKSGTATVSFNPVAGAVGLPDPFIPPSMPLGSGQAMAGLFVTMEKDKETKETYPVVFNDRARVYWPEISRMDATKGSQGSTLSAEMCQAFSSEELGSLTKTNCAYALPHSYRLIIAMGSQLATAGAALDPMSALMGLSQRVWWVCGETFDVPVEGTPEFEEWAERIPDSMNSDNDGAIDLPMPAFPAGNVPVDREVRIEVRKIRMRLQAAKRDPETALETHTALIRLRWAFAAAVYHGEAPAITKKWWDWTAIFEEHHRRVRRACQIAQPLLRTGEAVQAGILDDIRSSTREAAQHRDAKQNLLRWARAQHAAGKQFTAAQGANSGKAGSYRRQHGAQLVQELVEDGLLGVQLVHVPQVGGEVAYHGPTQLGLDVDLDAVQ
ncbi:bifunctional DNA primase/polymerase [Mycolicibacterium fortuitum]|uniref:bifunctional DNA primase/polymerase n=1 Tax=Mycolicibacterium fortuitum TaxID=1766 RepID=UPI001490274C|nr:bifunctional DNA primase/polymerase [Mycolicibacterium fortuitum]